MDAAYIVKILTLYQPLRFLKSTAPGSDISGRTQEDNRINHDETLTVYTNRIPALDPAPDKEKYLTAGTFCGFGLQSNTDGSVHAAAAGDIPDCTDIPAGTYLFVQGPAQTDTAAFQKNPLPDETMKRAAEAVYLESLWLEKPCADDTVYVRLIAEHHHSVFQIFRRIGGNQPQQ